jgi:hypothetical protein
VLTLGGIIPEFLRKVKRIFGIPPFCIKGADDQGSGVVCGAALCATRSQIAIFSSII